MCAGEGPGYFPIARIEGAPQASSTTRHKNDPGGASKYHKGTSKNLVFLKSKTYNLLKIFSMNLINWSF